MNSRSAAAYQLRNRAKGIKKAIANREGFKNIFIYATLPISVAPYVLDVQVQRKHTKYMY
jgi:hypothetical protein